MRPEWPKRPGEGVLDNQEHDMSKLGYIAITATTLALLLADGCYAGNPGVGGRQTL